MNKINKIGLIGIGNMGNDMAGQIARAGFDLTVYNVNAEACAKFAAQYSGRGDCC